MFVITSNYQPDDMWPDDEEMLNAIKRRFKVIELQKLALTDKTSKRKRSEDEYELNTDVEKPYKKVIKMPVPTAIPPKHSACKHGKCAADMPCFCAQNNYVAGKLASYTMSSMYP